MILLKRTKIQFDIEDLQYTITPKMLTEEEYQDKDILFMIVNRIIKDINEILLIKSLVLNNIENNKSILKQLEKSILLMDFNQNYLKRFLNTGTLTKNDLLDFYNGDDVKNKYTLIEKEINSI